MTKPKPKSRTPQSERVYLQPDQRERLSRAAKIAKVSKSKYATAAIMGQVERDLADAEFAVGEGQGPSELRQWSRRLHEMVDAFARELARAPGLKVDKPSSGD